MQDSTLRYLFIPLKILLRQVFIPRAPIVREVRSLDAPSQSAYSIHWSADSDFRI